MPPPDRVVPDHVLQYYLQSRVHLFPILRQLSGLGLRTRVEWKQALLHVLELAPLGEPAALALGLPSPRSVQWPEENGQSSPPPIDWRAESNSRRYARSLLRLSARRTRDESLRARLLDSAMREHSVELNLFARARARPWLRGEELLNQILGNWVRGRVGGIDRLSEQTPVAEARNRLFDVIKVQVDRQLASLPAPRAARNALLVAVEKRHRRLFLSWARRLLARDDYREPEDVLNEVYAKLMVAFTLNRVLPELTDANAAVWVDEPRLRGAVYRCIFHVAIQDRPPSKTPESDADRGGLNSVLQVSPPPEDTTLDQDEREIARETLHLLAWLLLNAGRRKKESKLCYVAIRVLRLEQSEAQAALEQLGICKSQDAIRSAASDVASYIEETAKANAWPLTLSGDANSADLEKNPVPLPSRNDRENAYRIFAEWCREIEGHHSKPHGGRR